MTASSNLDDLLLRTCTACLQELGELRRNVGKIDNKIEVLDSNVKRLTKGESEQSPKALVPSVLCVEGGATNSLSELCLIQDEKVREVFVNVLQEGELHLELQDLARRLSKGSSEVASLQHLRHSLPCELKRGSVRAAVFQARCRVNEREPLRVIREPIYEVEALLEDELVARIRYAQSQAPEVGQEEDKGCDTSARSDDVPATAIVLLPVFQGYCWPLAEAVLRWSHGERMVPTLDFVKYALQGLTGSPGAPSVEIDALALLRTAPSDFRLMLGVDERSQVVLHCCLTKQEKPEVSVDGQGSGAAELKTILEAATRCGAASQLLHSDSLEDCTNPCGAGSSALREITQQSHIFEVLVPLRTKKLALALGLPQQLTQASAGALCAACNSGSSSGNDTEASLVTKSPAAPTLRLEEYEAEPAGPSRNHVDVSGMLMHDGAVQPAERAAVDKIPPEDTLIDEEEEDEECGAIVPGISQEAGSAAMDSGAEDEVAENEGSEEDQESRSSQGNVKEAIPTESEGKVRTITQQQLAFIECFKKELFSQRTLLLSQLNNLYKMRSGEELNYKLSGYEKLRDFLLDIPGLALVGRGNRMQVRLQDLSKLEVFHLSWQHCAVEEDSAPQFRMPQTLPDGLLQQIHELFVFSERCEIPLRNFLTIWNMRFPTEQLCYRALGFRDVRGLLSQVPFIEKVGGKSDTKYLLTHAAGVPHPVAKAREPVARDPSSCLPSDYSRMKGYPSAGAALPPTEYGNGCSACSQPSAAPLWSPGQHGMARMMPGQTNGCPQKDACRGTAYPSSRGPPATFPDVNELLSDWTPRLPMPQQLGSAVRMQPNSAMFSLPRKPGLQQTKESFASSTADMLRATHAAYCQERNARGTDAVNHMANVAPEERGSMTGGWA
eukprot:CAMPEP_0172697252 /NCGR_PEP_ID=MMETSP1074-20121228/28616_1 /TAXON_ID=2916 /ORGANISM="Ceratium fusus, Strain PA161109" /LENGTH=894 /DNA_ID=CAMNT_0013518125 /DNA_START=17 /DNA_END=2698 /DNA_ORIENTATION=-